MQFRNYHHEKHSKSLSPVARKYNTYKHKVAVWNAFVDSQLAGINDDDFSILPRLLPESYLPIIEKTAREITTFCLRLITLPEREVRAIVPRGPIRDFLIDELEVLRYRPKRLTGSFRFDMAIVGPPHAKHPPQLLEINEIGFDGLARSTFFQETLLNLIPELRNRVVSLDTAAAEIRNMRRLGPSLARVQYDSYNWDEEFLLRTAQKMGFELRLVSPTHFPCEIDDDNPLMTKEKFSIEKGRVKIGKDFLPHSLNMSFAYSLKDYKEGQKLYSQLIRSKTPQYGPFLSGLVASKTILILLSDKNLRKKLLGSSRALEGAILPAFSLEGKREQVLSESQDLVLKHADGCGGEQVFMNQELLRELSKIPARKEHEWVLQKKSRLNLIDVNGILSRPKRGISDLGVFVHYDWEGGRYRHFEMGGLMSRATNRSLKVNVSGGGLQVAVMLEKGK